MRPAGTLAGMVRVMTAGVAFAVLCAVVALASEQEQPPSAVAHVLPRHYRLLLTEVSGRGSLHIARYGKPGGDADGPIVVNSIRGRGKPPYEFSPARYPGDRRTVVRGHRAVVRTLTDEGRAFARELVWSERPDLVVAVSADLPLRGRTLRRVAEGLRIVGQRAWARLHLQTSYAALLGHVTKHMRRLRVKRRRFGGHIWTLYALIPRRFPLSRDDLRVSCVELRYRRRRGHGDFCGVVPNWQRIGGRIFAFGAVPRGVKAVRIHPFSGHAFHIRVRTVRARRGPHVRYFATPLPTGACAVVVSPEGSVAAPIRGPDQRRCARAPG